MLYLARHGRTSWTGERYCGRSDPPLDDRGLADARRLACELGPVIASGAEIVTSPLRRARETASALSSREARVDRRAIEVDFGQADGLTFSEIASRWPPIAAAILRSDVAIDWPGGETWSAVRSRAEMLIASLTRGRDVVVVTHGAFVSALGYALGIADALLPPGAVRAIAL
jgi:broad specificity phosphatase PhoE